MLWFGKSMWPWTHKEFIITRKKRSPKKTKDEGAKREKKASAYEALGNCTKVRCKGSFLITAIRV